MREEEKTATDGDKEEKRRENKEEKNKGGK